MSDNTSSNNRIAKNTVFLYIRMIVVLLVSLYTTRVVLNELGVVDYGIYNVVAGFVSMFAFFNSAMNSSIQRYYNYEKGIGTTNSLNIVFVTAFQIQILLAVVTIIMLESFGLWYIDNKMVIPLERLSSAKLVFHFSVMSLVLVIMQIPYSAAIISHEKMNYYAFVSIIDTFLKLGCVLFLPFCGYDKMLLYGILLLMISLTNFVFYLVYAHAKFKEIRLRLCFHKGKFKEMLSFSGWSVFGSFAYMLRSHGLNVLINAFFNPAINAARAIAFQVQAAINGFSENIAMAFKPQLVESYAKGSFARSQMLMYSMSKYGYMMLFVLSVPIVIELRFVLDVWLKGVIPEYTIVFTYLVLANMLLNSLNMPLTQAVHATGYVKTYEFVRSFIVASTLPISWFFLKMGASPTMVFWVTLFISIINQPISMILLHKQFPFSYLEYIKKVILPCVLISIIIPVIPFIVHFFMPEGIIRFILVCLVTVIVSLASIYIFFIDSSEKEMVSAIIINVKFWLIVNYKERFTR